MWNGVIYMVEKSNVLINNDKGDLEIKVSIKSFQFLNIHI